MHSLVLLLSRQLKQVVIDNTGLQGWYDFNLDWTPDDARPAVSPGPDAPAPQPPPDTAAPGIFKAIEQQLGLKREAKKTPVEILVVDRAKKVPIGN